MRADLAGVVVEDHLDIPEAAHFLSVSVETIRRWIWTRELPAVRRGNGDGKLFVPLSALRGKKKVA